MKKTSEKSLEEAVHASYDDMRHLRGISDVRLDVDIQSDAPFASDRFRVSTILNNLISNAIKYHDPQKSEHFVKVEGQISAEVARLSFRDNGIGIDPKFHENLFKMFFRASHQSFGSGLGLYIVKEMMDKLDGNIQFESAPGVGTTFHIEIRNHFDMNS
ncbi:MAG: HAMP domain-containing sensor histidine kinase [Bacteroidota bacterium]